jgi:hypothetical protein
VNALEVARLDLHLSLPDLWLGYFALGGTMDVAGLGSYLAGEPSPTPSDADHDAIVHALNEAYGDIGKDHPVPYRAA